MNQTDKKEGLKIVRIFNAPKALVFEAFSKEEAFAEWWGPVGSKLSVLHFDFRPQGKIHYKMDGQGQVMWGLFNFRQIVEQELIEFVNSFSDEAGNICTSPFPIDFPLEVFNHISFEEHNGTTTMRLSGYPINATAEQEATYYSMIENMNEGFGGTLDQLEAYLNKIQA